MRLALLAIAATMALQSPAAAPKPAGLANSITGRVTDSDGKPVAGATVTLLFRENVLGRQ